MAERLLERINIESAFVPVDMSSAANNGDWVSLENYQGVLAILFKGAGTAGDDPVFTLRQATDASGTDAKALNFTAVYHKVGTLASVTAWTKTAQSAANTYTDAASAEAQAIIAVDIRSQDLDVAGGFTHVQLQIPDVGANAQVGAGLYLLYDPRHIGATPDSALA